MEKGKYLGVLCYYSLLFHTWSLLHLFWFRFEYREITDLCQLLTHFKLQIGSFL